MSREDLVALLGLGLVAAAGGAAPRRRMSKKVFSTILGILCLGVILLIIMCVALFRSLDNINTEKKLDALAIKVANNDQAALMNWAEGNEKDVWGNTFILDENREFVRFVSKGYDQKLGTTDDLRSKLYEKKPKEIPVSSVLVNVELKKRTWAGFAWDQYKNWRGNEK